jgi:putative transposase
LLNVTRSVVYEQDKRLLKEADESELQLLQWLDEEYTRHPFYGSRRMKLYLGDCGHTVNRKRVQRLMQKSYRPRRAGGLTVVSSPKGCHG